MTSADVIRIMTTEGGLWSPAMQRFVSRDCPYFKLRVWFHLSSSGPAFELGRGREGVAALLEFSMKEQRVLPFRLLSFPVDVVQPQQTQAAAGVTIYHRQHGYLRRAIFHQAQRFVKTRRRADGDWPPRHDVCRA